MNPKWASKLAGHDTWAWNQCFAMEQSLRIDERDRSELPKMFSRRIISLELLHR
ncbi:MAG: hypothetical protein ABI972_03310 [Acidobacteriota bacterium]